MTNIPEILKEFDEKFGGFIATKEKRVKQDEDNAWLREKLEALLGEISSQIKRIQDDSQVRAGDADPWGITEEISAIIESKK